LSFVAQQTLRKRNWLVNFDVKHSKQGAYNSSNNGGNNIYNDARTLHSNNKFVNSSPCSHKRP